MERYKGPRVVTALIGLGVGATVLAGCGQDSAPSPENVEDNIQYMQLDEVLDGNGMPVRCVMYGSGTSWTSESKSWFAFSCDFTGEGQFPGEPLPVVTEGK